MSVICIEESTRYVIYFPKAELFFKRVPTNRRYSPNLGKLHSAKTWENKKLAENFAKKYISISQMESFKEHLEPYGTPEVRSVKIRTEWSEE